MKHFAGLLLLLLAGTTHAYTLDFTNPSVPTTGSAFTLGGLRFQVTPDPAPNPPGYQTDPSNILGICPGCELTITDLGDNFAAGYDAFTLFDIGFSDMLGDYTVRLTVNYSSASKPSENIDILASDGIQNLNLFGIKTLTISNLSGTPTLISHMSVNAIPAPAAVWLFFSALASVGWLRKKR